MLCRHFCCRHRKGNEMPFLPHDAQRLRAAMMAYEMRVREERERRRFFVNMRHTLVVCAIVIAAIMLLAWLGR